MQTASARGRQSDLQRHLSGRDEYGYASANHHGRERETKVSVIAPTIELKTIDDRHRYNILLGLFGAKVILRLAIDPVRQSPDVAKRAVMVDRISPASGENRWEETREIGWADLPEQLDRCMQLPFVLNE